MQEAIDQLVSGINQGLVSPADLEALNKALTAGYGGAGKPTDLTGGGVLQAESLDATLKSVTFDSKNIVLWQSISIDKAYNLFEQYNRIISYGSDSAPYIGEGGAPMEEDAIYVRDGQKIVFFGVRMKVSHQMTLVRNTVGDIIAQRVKEGTLHMLKSIERELYWGHAHFLNQLTGALDGSDADLPANSIEMNGLLKQIKKGDTDVLHRSGDFEGYGDSSSVVKDLRGDILMQDDIEKLAVVALENFGHPTELHIEPAALSAFVRQFYPQFRSEPGLANQTVGYSVSNITTSAGRIDFKPNVFLRPRSTAKMLAVSPAAPALGSLAVTAAGAGTGSALDAGTYQIKVTLRNDHGESIPLQLAPVTITAGQNIDLTVTNMPAGVKSIRVYMSAPGGAVGTEKFVGAFASKGNATYRLAGRKLPGLGEAFLLDLSPETMKFKQLSPLTKINFAIVTTALEFALVLYGALFVYAPRFNGVFENVGK